MKNLSIRNAKYAKQGLQDLCDMVNLLLQRPISMIEIGSFSGDSAAIFAKNFESVICVDPWQSNYDSTGVDKASDPQLYNMNEVENEFNKLLTLYPNIIKLKTTSRIACKELKSEGKKFDMVYIDALHTYEGVKEDIMLWRSMVGEDGIISGHDYHSKHFPGVKKAVDEFFTQEQITTFLDSSWMVRV